MSQEFGASGGTGGGAYNAASPPAQDHGPWKIGVINGRSGGRIDLIELVWVNSQHATRESARFGGNTGGPFQFTIADDDYLTEIRGSVGAFDDNVRVFSLQFLTRDGGASPVFGQPSGVPFFFECPNGFQLTGIFGRSGSGLDSLGVFMENIP